MYRRRRSFQLGNAHQPGGPSENSARAKRFTVGGELFRRSAAMSQPAESPYIGGSPEQRQEVEQQDSNGTLDGGSNEQKDLERRYGTLTNSYGYASVGCLNSVSLPSSFSFVRFCVWESFHSEPSNLYKLFGYTKCYQ
ncbi:hypothetical protein ElyMa_004248700 [Elysia marginata]|uniref:Uncharacterized protein n=1 Tax=Elysia marginata TaxID=1093978 RepID=A0AAV4GUV0_9GAST|nr:hypothetical protein ElyMa_004248700 [Elysia marginata]